MSIYSHCISYPGSLFYPIGFSNLLGQSQIIAALFALLSIFLYSPFVTQSTKFKYSIVIFVILIIYSYIINSFNYLLDPKTLCIDITFDFPIDQ